MSAISEARAGVCASVSSCMKYECIVDMRLRCVNEAYDFAVATVNVVAASAIYIIFAYSGYMVFYAHIWKLKKTQDLVSSIAENNLI